MLCTVWRALVVGDIMSRIATVVIWYLKKYYNDSAGACENEYPDRQ